MPKPFDMEAHYDKLAADHERKHRHAIKAVGLLEKIIAQLEAGKEPSYLDDIDLLKVLGIYHEGYDNEFNALAAEIEENSAPPTREEWRHGERDYNRKAALDMGA